MKTIFTKLNDRQLWRSLIAYPAASFVILQAVDFFISKYGWNPKLLTFSLILLVGGFPAVLIWNWNHGTKGFQVFKKSEIFAYLIISFATVGWARYYWANARPTQDLNQAITRNENSPALAILPFSNESRDSALAYLSDGIPENLINRLSQQNELKVLSRNSTFSLQESERNANSVRTILDANLMLIGQMNSIGNQLIINCQLIDLIKGSQVWGKKINYTNDNMLLLEDSIVNSLFHSLQ